METEVRRGRLGFRVTKPFMAIVDQLPAGHGRVVAVAREYTAAWPMVWRCATACIVRSGPRELCG